MEIRCSGLARPMVCSGFVYLNLFDVEAGDPAKEGTAAGEYLEYLLTNRQPPVIASNGVRINDDMKFYCNPIAKDVLSRAATPVLCETRIDWKTKSGITIRGQYDICFVDHQGRLCIEDLKYGWGIVEVEENWQLLGYAIGECIRRQQEFEYISFKIHQPRPHHEKGMTREWVLTWGELWQYYEKIENRMIEIVHGRRELTTSSKCKYCMGAAEACPAFNRLFYRSLEVTAEFYQDSITNDELARQLDEVKRAKEVIKIKEDSLIELGKLRMRNGGIIPGYIQSQNYGHRQWKDGITPEAIEVMTGYNTTEKVFMSPSKAEKLGIPKELVNQLSQARYLGLKLEKKNQTEVANKIFGEEEPVRR